MKAKDVPFDPLGLWRVLPERIKTDASPVD
jgi:hypothetical protein